MVAPHRAQQSKRREQSSSSNSYMVLLVKLLLILLILLLLPKLVTSRRRSRKNRDGMSISQLIYQDRLDCETTECISLIPEESMNCILECLSSTCFAQVYGSSPLEPGEVDLVRFDLYDTCVTEEVKQERREKRKAAKNE